MFLYEQVDRFGKPPAYFEHNFKLEELQKWMAYRSIHPSESVKDDLRLALLRHSIFCTVPGAARQIKVHELIPKWQAPPPLTPKQRKEFLLAWIKSRKKNKKVKSN